MSTLSLILLVMTVVGSLYYVLSAVALIAHFRSPITNSQLLASVSVLKPICGIDAKAGENMRSYLRQDYPNHEVIFGVLDSEDPAVRVIGETEGAELVVGSRINGTNNKVRILHSLTQRSSGELLVIADADTRVEPDFLSRVVAPFSDPRVGVVTCLYRGVEATGPASVLESLHMTCVFAPGVACAKQLGGIDFGLGAAIAIPRSVLGEIGGFEAIADYLADDFQLGRRAALAGYRVVLSDYVVEIVLGRQSLGNVLARELRWSRTTRVSRPVGHFGLVATFGFAYSLAFLLSTGFSALGWIVLSGVLTVRTASAWAGSKAMGAKDYAFGLCLLPLRDLLSFGVWIAGYLAHSVKWRGRRMRLLRDGRMSPIA